MTFLDWSSSFETGIESFDSEHHELLRILNTLYERVVRGAADDDAVGQTLDDVLAFASEHFDREERAMRETGYPKLDVHRKQHRALLEKLMDYRRRLREHGNLSVEVTKFLIDWFLMHTTKEDKAYANHLKARGIA